MEVLTSYPHHQLGGDLVQHSLYGVEPSQACGNEVPKQQDLFPQGDSTITGREQEQGSEEEVRQSQEKNSDVGDLSQSGSTSKNSKKNSKCCIKLSQNNFLQFLSQPYFTFSEERAQVDYLLSSLPAVKKYFKVHGKIGEGTFSSVFLASLKDTTFKHQFAIKHLIPTTHPSRAERELKCLQDIG